jgi:very-short-patch-repair endonuclease
MGDKAREPGARDRALATLAGCQHGVVARRQLLDLGFTPRMVERRIESGRLHPVHRGVYAVGHGRLTQRGRWSAAVLACGPDAVLSHRSAAALWGMAWPWRGGAVEVSAAGRRRRPSILVHDSRVAPFERARIGGIAVTSVPRTLLDLASALDASRLERTWEEADRLGLLRLAELQRVCANANGRRGAGLLRRLLADAREPIYSRSSLERAFATFCRRRGLPMPILNATVLGREVDAYWPRERLAVELDGYAFHRHRAAFERDRARDAAFQASGISVIRLTRRRLRDAPDLVEAQIRHLLGTRRTHA